MKAFSLSLPVVMLLFIVGGIGLVASIYDADWFFAAGGARWLTERMGRGRARFVSAVLGLVLLGIALLNLAT